MRKPFVVIAAILLSSLFVFAADDATITSVSGSATVKAAETSLWYSARTGAAVKSGQKVKTMPRSRVRIDLPDGSRVEVNANSQVDLSSLKSKNPTFALSMGKLKAWVSKNAKRASFQVRTPIAVCSVRGTEFTVEVDKDGKTEIEVDKGLVGVRTVDGTGEEVPVGAGESLSVSGRGALTGNLKRETGAEEKAVRREVGLEMNKEEVQNAAAAEMRLAEYQEGKAMVDVNGMRVRLEEYIMRPAADTFKLVVLNERDSRFDYFYYKGKFNKELPQDLGTALQEMGGKVGETAPDYYLTEYEQAFSNTQDYSKDTASGGHPVKITYNNDGTFTLTDGQSTKNIDAYNNTDKAYNPLADTFDASQSSALDLSIYNPATDKFEAFTAGETVWKTRFNSYEHVINGIRKQEYIPTDPSKGILVADEDGHWVYPSLDSEGNTIYGEWGIASGESTAPDADVLHNRLKLNYFDGTFEQYDTYIISDEGKIASSSEFNGITSGREYKDRLLNWNYEQVMTASEFQGRKIDLVVEPKIFIKSGLIK